MPARPCPPGLLRGLPAGDRKKVQLVFRKADEHITRLQRRSGKSYAEHGADVALVLREVSDDPSLIAIALVHDVFLLPGADRMLRSFPLSAEERRLALRMHELRRLHIDTKTRDLDCVIAAFAEDERLLILRMAHRLSDVRSLMDFSPKIRRAIAHETLHMYASIAGRLSMHAWRQEMEDICFRFLHPVAARNLGKKIRSAGRLDLVCLRHAQGFITRKLRAQGISCQTTYRIKGLYSTYRKMILKNRTFWELTDRLAIRITVKEIDTCYRALGVIHAIFHPIPGKLKDYIGAPKENNYRSIHTVVYPLPGVSEQPMEIQIRTREMDAECECGIAHHADYKHSLYVLQTKSIRVELFRNLESLRKSSQSPRQFEKALRQYFDENQIAVFDARNTLYHLPKPVTARSFVRHAYGESVDTLSSVLINGRKLSPDTPLHDGDTVTPRFRRNGRS